MIRVVLPAHLRNLARADGELKVEVSGPTTPQSVLDALEAAYPMLRGTIRDHVTHKRRPFIRFYACEQDLSNEAPDTPLPEAVATGKEPFLVVGAIAGGLQPLPLSGNPIPSPSGGEGRVAAVDFVGPRSTHE
jgi:hypothetical protein